MSVLDITLVPPRSLNLTTPVWGIDPSTQVMALAILGDGEPVLEMMLVEQADKFGRRLALLGNHLVPWLREMEARHGSPGYVLVEEPFATAHHIHPQSYYCVGVLLATLASLFECPLGVAPPGGWKREALGAGHGAARKGEIAAWAEMVLGYPAPSQDAADALGIATAGAIRFCSQVTG